MSAKAAIVTGGTSGIGQTVARRLAADGHRVAFCSRSEPDAGRQLADEIDGLYVRCDISDPAQAEAFGRRAIDEFGRLDVLVNNAAATARIPWADLASNTPEIWHRILSTNLVAPYVLTTATESALRESAGCIVNIGSLAGVRAVGQSIPYAASKAALHHLTTILARVLAPDVRVNAVAPGFIITPWTTGGQRASMTGRFVEATPLARGGSTDEVADSVMGLVRATFTTGQTVLVDGGVSTSTI